MKPPFTITGTILSEVSHIERLIGRVEGLHQPRPQPHLRKSNRVKTVQGSLAIEGNTLALDEVTAILEGKRVPGDRREILEVQNAIRAYEKLTDYKPYSSKALLQAHGILMKGLIETAGDWRSGNVGVLKGSQVSHMAPKAHRVPPLMDELFAYIKASDDHPLITGCVFHYELEFIHPFEDGNGRIGRLWHSVLLYCFHPVFEFIPVESLIKANQADYYKALETSDQAGNSTVFVEFMLEMIRQALAEFLDDLKPEPVTAHDRLALAQGHFGQNEFSRKDYLGFFKTLSSATASRDLKLGTDTGLLHKFGERAQTRYRFT